jgi:L-sorbose 1-phosphate reductase
MPESLKDYKAATLPLPQKIKRWHLYGAGIESLEEVTIDLPHPGPGELLVRHDVCSICFSDIKIINLGPNHPRLQGRDMRKNPVVMGHEVSLTIMGVGENLKNQFAVGQRYALQPDVYYHGVNMSYGYVLDGGMAQYGIVTKEVLNGDTGCYLIPIADTTGYAEAALVEPWACVVAAYEYPNYRDGIKDGGNLLVVNVDETLPADEETLVLGPGHQPENIVTVKDLAATDFTKLRLSETQDHGFDDIIIFGTPSADDFSRIATTLGNRGIVNLVSNQPIEGKVAIDIGRVHYEQQLFIQSSDPSAINDAYTANTRKDIRSGGKVWFVGAGGPMGQMHIQRAIMLEKPPKTIVVTDTNDERLTRIRERFDKVLKTREIELILVNPASGGNVSMYGPFDDIVSMVPSAALVVESIPHLAQDGVYNIFAGVAKGTIAKLDLATILSHNQRLIGTSGSSIDDLRHTLHLVETGALSTNASVAAIAGLDAFRDGLEAVKAGAFPGKTIIFPMIPELPLMSIEEIKTKLPGVYEKLLDGAFWTNEAEEELMLERL